MIDWTRVIELRDEVGAEDLMEVVDLFLEEVEGALSDLTPDAAAPDMAEKMHFLKGSALNIGFKDMAAICAQGEKDANDGNVAAIDTIAVQSSYASSKELFLQNLEENIAA
jgi:HPt (histidine-containing phosphotransfer) domain-containing protein